MRGDQFLRRSPGSRLWQALLALVLVLTAALLPAPTVASPAVASAAPTTVRGDDAGPVLGPVVGPRAATAATDQPVTPQSEGVGPAVPKKPATAPGFEVHDAGWVTFAYHRRQSGRVRQLFHLAEKTRQTLRAQLGEDVLRQVTVYVAQTPNQMASFTPRPASVPPWASGLAFPKLRLVLLSIYPPGHAPHDPEDFARTFQHELAHVALHDAVRGNPVPRWLDEGYAVQASGETRLNTLWAATVSKRLMTIDQLDRAFHGHADPASVAYAQSADMAGHLMRGQDAERFRRLVGYLREGRSFDGAFNDAYGISPSQFHGEWLSVVRQRYNVWPLVLGGGFMWFGAIGLAVWAWRVKRRRAKETLDRWDREEEEAARLAAQAAAQQEPRMHIVFSRGPEATLSVVDDEGDLGAELSRVRRSDPDIPKVEHDGNWHTLH